MGNSTHKTNSPFTGPPQQAGGKGGLHSPPVSQSYPVDEEFRNAGPQSFETFFEASVKGVQTCFPHLEPLDIAHPPFQWLDADFARQIAMHMMVNQFDISHGQIIEGLQQSRAKLKRAMARVEERLANDGFADAYGQMEAKAKAVLEGDDQC